MRRGLRSAVAPSGLSSSTGCPVSHSSLPVALLASHPPCGSLWAAPKAPLGPRFPSGQFAALTRREKALDCPFCRRGSLCRAHPNWQNFTCYRARSELAFFRRQNGRAFFPPLPIAALPRRSWRGHTQPLRRGVRRRKLNACATTKGQREIQSTLAFSASHEARRRMAVSLRPSCFSPSALRA